MYSPNMSIEGYHSFICSFIYSIIHSTYLLNTHYVSEAVLAARDIAGHKTGNVPAAIKLTKGEGS